MTPEPDNVNMAQKRPNQSSNFSKNLDWFNTHLKDIVERYGEGFVIVHDEKVLDHDPNFRSLFTRYREKYGHIPGSYIEYATTKPKIMIL